MTDKTAVNPTVNGLYATEIYNGWKLLEWADSGWQDEYGHKWLLGVSQWVGPLPERIYCPLEISHKNDG